MRLNNSHARLLRHGCQVPVVTRRTFVSKSRPRWRSSPSVKAFVDESKHLRTTDLSVQGSCHDRFCPEIQVLG